MIKARGLTKRYGETLAVDHLSFDITPGVVTGFLGPNGSGKSTTMRMILGLDTPTSGSVTVNGKAYRDLPAPMREVGALLDAKSIHGGRTARQQLRWVAQAAGIPSKRVDEVLDTVGLIDVAGKKVGGFSLGMSQRLGIATALLGDPGVLIFDEPVNGLDPEGILWFRNLMKRLASEGRTIFVSSHLMSEMQEMAQHVLVIGRGKIIADATISDVTGRNSGNAVRVVTPQLVDFAPFLESAGATIQPERDGGVLVTGIDAARIGELAAMHRIPLHELSPRRASLEAAFMELTRESVEYHANGSQPDADDIAETARMLAGKKEELHV
ncbi:MAG TPA: ABC transporter ATP-binding protein [Thermomicrobiales bacterium]|nr:ABC transporter ATP-binding protein [Thermomicrobiales bacterium]